MGPEFDTEPLLVVVTGLPGTGKSTVAEDAAEILGAPVLAHDWAMSGLRNFPVVQSALDSMDPPGHGVVGWSILCALAQAQLRRGSPVVLDGVARSAEIEMCRRIAESEGTRFVVILAECTDPLVHRSRIEGRVRTIPNWYELDWADVERSRSRWQSPGRPDVTLQATDSRDQNRERLVALLRGSHGR